MIVYFYHYTELLGVFYMLMHIFSNIIQSQPIEMCSICKSSNYWWLHIRLTITGNQYWSDWSYPWSFYFPSKLLNKAKYITLHFPPIRLYFILFIYFIFFLIFSQVLTPFLFQFCPPIHSSLAYLHPTHFYPSIFLLPSSDNLI